MSFAGWLFKQDHLITSGSTLTDYQVKFTIYKTTGTSSGSSIYLNTHCNDDFSDIRFSVDGVTSLPYWIESITGSGATLQATIWVKLPSISTTTLSIYYGNSSATSESNGANTFIFFDTFNTLDTDKWGYSSGVTPTVSTPGILSVSYTGGAQRYFYSKAYTHTNDVVVHAKVKCTTGVNVAVAGCILPGSTYEYGLGSAGVTTTEYLFKHTPSFASLNTYTKTSVNTTNWFEYIIAPNPGALKGKLRNYDGGSYPTSWETSSTDATLSLGYVGLAFYNASSEAFTCDWIFVRTYAATEPSHSTYTTEQYIGGNEIIITPTPTSGSVPLSVSFNISIPAPLTNFELIYGDGESYTSSTQTSFATTHIYDNFGTYTIYAKGYNGSTLLENYTTVIASENSLTATFTKSQNLNVITFTDTTTGSPDEWYWGFGDATYSQEQNPTHLYDTPGTYIVTLYASNQQYNGVATSSITIDNPAPNVTITLYSYDDLNVPSRLSFRASPIINESLNESITSYSWTLNDATTSTLSEFSKYFTNYGDYVATLTIVNNYGLSFATSTTFTLGCLPIADFTPQTLLLISPTLPYTVTFDNLSYPTDIPSTTYLWEFGTYATSTSFEPEYAFATIDNYDVSLTINNPYGSDTITYNDAIRLTRKGKTLIESLSYVDSVATFNVEVFNEVASGIDPVVVYATILPESFTVVQREFPSVPGVDEWGIVNLYRTVNALGSYVMSVINEWGHRILKIPTFDDQTGFTIYHAKEFREDVVLTDDQSNQRSS